MTPKFQQFIKNWLTDHKNTLGVGSRKAEIELNAIKREWRRNVCVFIQKRKRGCFCVLSCSAMSDSFVTTPLSMEFPRQEYWSGLWFLSPGDLPYPGIEPASLVSPPLAGRFFYQIFFYRFTTAPPGKLKRILKGFESESVSCSVVSNSLQLHGLFPTQIQDVCVC